MRPDTGIPCHVTWAATENHPASTRQVDDAPAQHAQRFSAGLTPTMNARSTTRSELPRTSPDKERGTRWGTKRAQTAWTRQRQRTQSPQAVHHASETGNNPHRDQQGNLGPTLTPINSSTW